MFHTQERRHSRGGRMAHEDDKPHSSGSSWLSNYKTRISITNALSIASGKKDESPSSKDKLPHIVHSVSVGSFCELCGGGKSDAKVEFEISGVVDVGDSELCVVTFTEADLKYSGNHTICKYPVVCKDEENEIRPFPKQVGLCSINGSLILVGGKTFEKTRKRDVRVSQSDLILKLNSASRTWSILGRMKQARSSPEIVPFKHNGCTKMFICWGIRADSRLGHVEIHNMEESSLKDMDGDRIFWSVPNDDDDEDDDIWCGPPCSSFIYERKGQSPLIMVYCLMVRDPDRRPLSKEEEEGEDEMRTEARLSSYDVDANQWKIFDKKLPLPSLKYIHNNYGRNLIPVGDTLFIIDQASCWTIYDLSQRKVVGKLEVKGLEKDLDRPVFHAFLLGRCPDDDCGSLVFFIFVCILKDYGEEEDFCTDMSYAKVHVKVEEDHQGSKKPCDAHVVLQGVLRFGTPCHGNFYGSWIEGLVLTKAKFIKEKDKLGLEDMRVEAAMAP